MAEESADKVMSKSMEPFLDRLQQDIIKTSGADLGYCVFIFNNQENGLVNYGSNCNMDEVAKAMREVLANWEMEKASNTHNNLN